MPTGTSKWKIVMIVIAIILIILCLLEFAMESPSPRISVSKVLREFREIGIALEAYKESHGRYPAVLNMNQPDDSTSSSITFIDVRSIGLMPANIWPCYAWGDSSYNGPFDYRDWFTANRWHASPFPYRYFTKDQGWILISAGPDGVYDINPSKDYDPDISQPSLHLLTIAGTYDSTNGAVSKGDIWKLCQ